MKSLSNKFAFGLVITSFLCSVHISKAQNWSSIDCYELPSSFFCINNAITDTINPLEDSAFFQVDTSDLSNAWQYGHSWKPEFDSASAPLGWITDTINSYGQELMSHLVVDLPAGISATNWIIFEHKYSMDTITEAGYLEFSCDGTNWSHLNSSTYPYLPIEVMVDNFNDPFLFHDSVYSFTGSSNGWIWSGAQFIWFLPVFHGEENRMSGGCDSFSDLEYFQVRFTFESDSVSNHSAGWMIRQIVIGSNDIGNSVNDSEKAKIGVHPNPSNGIITIDHNISDFQTAQLIVTDILGNVVHSQLHENTTIDLSHLGTGTYILQLENGEEVLHEKLVIW